MFIKNANYYIRTSLTKNLLGNFSEHFLSFLDFDIHILKCFQESDPNTCFVTAIKFDT